MTQKEKTIHDKIIRDFVSAAKEVERFPSTDDSETEFSETIKERYSERPMHPICKACRRSMAEKKKCYQTVASGLYHFECSDKE